MKIIIYRLGGTIQTQEAEEVEITDREYERALRTRHYFGGSYRISDDISLRDVVKIEVLL